MKNKLALVSISFFLFNNPILAKSLHLNEYLKEVEENNATIKSSKSSINGLDLRKNESSLLFKPVVFAQGQTAMDKKPTTNVNAQGDRTDYSFANIGLMEQFSFGLKSKLSYTLSHTKIFNAAQSFLPVPDFKDSQMSLELSQSLWRNFFGVENKAQENLIRSDVKAKMLIENYKIKNILSSAESIYWSLSQMKKMITVQKESLERAIKIKKWAENRFATGLGDKSDLLQSDANVKFREYELKTIEQQYKSLSRTFNSLRNVESDVVDSNLDEIKPEYVKNLSLKEKSELRDDTKAAIEFEKLSKANLDMSIERNKPNLEIYGSYALNGRAIDQSTAINNGFKTNHSTTAIGIRFQTPLDFSNLIDNIRGYKSEQNSAELTVKQKLFDQEKEWNELASKFKDAKDNLLLAEKIAEAQKIKSINERDKLSKGRTITFQVLNFEQDYAQSELLRLKSELEILNLYSQSKTFSSEEKHEYR